MHALVQNKCLNIFWHIGYIEYNKTDERESPQEA